MDRIKVTVKGVEEQAWDMMHEIRETEQRFMGAIISDCIFQYYAEQFDPDYPNENTGDES